MLSYHASSRAQLVGIQVLDARHASQARFAGHTCTHGVQCGVTTARSSGVTALARALGSYLFAAHFALVLRCRV